MSSGCSSSSSPSAAEVGEGYWEARDEPEERLEVMSSRDRGEVELSAEESETNNQHQEDEVLYRLPQLLIRLFVGLLPKSAPRNF
jgi:E3 ubiquitin-protein ligase RNF14